MSKEALKGFQDAEVDQTYRNQARNIWTHVDNAREDYVASLRWPFELFQNALDAGPRTDKSCVDVSVCHKDSVLKFEHDGPHLVTRTWQPYYPADLIKNSNH